MKRSVGAYALVLLALVRCGKETAPPAAPSAAPLSSSDPVSSNGVTEAGASTPAASVASPAEPPKPAGPTPVAKWADVGLAKPESIVYDADGDRYLVSNINGGALAKDDNGFVSVLSPDGQLTTLKWIEGGKNKVSLDGPKGLVIVDGLLYATDITNVRVFDRKTGAPKGTIPVPGSTSLNDIAVAPDGKIYVSDTGKKVGADGKTLEPNGNDSIYVIEGGTARTLAKRKDLRNPNGIVWTDNGLVAVTNDASGEVYRLDEKLARQDVTKLPTGTLDGLLALGDSLLVTSWAGNAIYRGKLGGSFEVLIADLKSPADIGYDTKRGRLLVPLLLENTVFAYELK
jgi:SMP-30/gluconolaconase/LRE-like protein